MFQLTVFVTCTLILRLSILVEGNSGPTVTVNCSNGFDMEIIVTGVNDTDEWKEDDWSLNNATDSSCKPTFNNKTETVTYRFDGPACDPVIENRTDFFVYFFRIYATPSGDVPVLRYDHDYNVTCLYDRNGTAISNFIPIHDLSDTVTATENLTVSLTLAEDDFGGAPFGSAIPLTTTIFAELIITNPFLAPLDLSLDECFFSKNEAGDDGKFPFITNSCENPNAASTASPDYNCSLYTNETERFTFEAVRYPGQDNGDKVYVTCDFYVCFAENTTSFCRERCGGCKRKRRDLEDSVYAPSDQHTYRVRAGPYSFVEQETDADEGGQEFEADKGLTENSIIVLAVSCVVAIAIVCATVVVVLHKRRTKLAASQMAMENPACETGETKMAI